MEITSFRRLKAERDTPERVSEKTVRESLEKYYTHSETIGLIAFLYKGETVFTPGEMFWYEG